MREELMTARAEEFTSKTRLAKREESVIATDKIIAMVVLSADCVGFIAMRVAASHLSVSGIYGSIFFLLLGAGALPSISALNVDFLLAQSRPTDDLVAARDAFLGFLNLLQTVMVSLGPLISVKIYRWSIDHGLSAVAFFWTSCSSFISLLFVFSVSFFSS